MYACCMHNKMVNKNKPVRMSDEVKRELLKIKKDQELKSIDAVLKKLLKQGGRPDLV